jgi:hypothetical protein
MSAAAPAPAQPALTLDTASQAKSLDDIAGLAEGLDSAAAGDAPGAPGGPPVPSLAEENAKIIRDLVCLARDAGSDALDLKAPRAIATDTTVAGLAAGWGEWSAKRGYDLKRLMGDNGDTIPLALATAALAWSVFTATRMELAARRPIDAKAKPAAAAPAAAPGAANDSGIIKPAFQ